ncbi:hypothetical protein Cgig2_021770 [Carnegiea gigantea]|uniref:Uncharacterized protein n=1 Tax=Carnegiea gigantea TaxID=171969 RepID=A0A9Q1JIN1_9CARY|nr:hypothetical protein Cgig2_021770 [Carnegiea gigantea]
MDNYSDVQHEEPIGEAAIDVVLRHQCTLEVVCSLNVELEEVQKSAVEGTVWRPVLKYRPFVMDRHLVQALVECWNPETKAFKVGSREIPFSVYDMALQTGLPATGKQVTFDRGLVHLRNYVSVIMELCKQNNTPERLDLFRKLSSLLVMSELLFMRTAGGVAWELIGITEDVEGMGEYN